MTGLTLLGFSIWTVLEKMDIALLVQPTYSITVYGMVAVGALVLLTSILGCQGTVQEHRCSLLLVSYTIQLYPTPVSPLPQLVVHMLLKSGDRLNHRIFHPRGVLEF